MNSYRLWIYMIISYMNSYGSWFQTWIWGYQGSRWRAAQDLGCASKSMPLVYATCCELSNPWPDKTAIPRLQHWSCWKICESVTDLQLKNSTSDTVCFRGNNLGVLLSSTLFRACRVSPVSGLGQNLRLAAFREEAGVPAEEGCHKGAMGSQ